MKETFVFLFDCKDCRTDEFIKQKLDYMHNNLCKGKWNLSSCPEQYKHSSTYFYATGNQGYYPVTTFVKLKDIDLSKFVE
jgi:hypothetical protein